MSTALQHSCPAYRPSVCVRVDARWLSIDGGAGAGPWKEPGMESPAREMARRHAENAEAVCRHYLPGGRREGRYWLVGDVRGTPGRSLYVRLKDSPKGPAGKWNDAATGEHGDLQNGSASWREGVWTYL